MADFPVYLLFNTGCGVNRITNVTASINQFL